MMDKVYDIIEYVVGDTLFQDAIVNIGLLHEGMGREISIQVRKENLGCLTYDKKQTAVDCSVFFVSDPNEDRYNVYRDALEIKDRMRDQGKRGFSIDDKSYKIVVDNRGLVNLGVNKHQEQVFMLDFILYIYNRRR